jgi:hypothetical protein
MRPAPKPSDPTPDPYETFVDDVQDFGTMTKAEMLKEVQRQCDTDYLILCNAKSVDEGSSILRVSSILSGLWFQQADQGGIEKFKADDDWMKDDLRDDIIKYIDEFKSIRRAEGYINGLRNLLSSPYPKQNDDIMIQLPTNPNDPQRKILQRPPHSPGDIHGGEIGDMDIGEMDSHHDQNTHHIFPGPVGPGDSFDKSEALWKNAHTDSDTAAVQFGFGVIGDKCMQRNMPHLSSTCRYAVEGFMLPDSAQPRDQATVYSSPSTSSLLSSMLRTFSPDLHSPFNLAGNTTLSNSATQPLVILLLLGVTVLAVLRLLTRTTTSTAKSSLPNDKEKVKAPETEGLPHPMGGAGSYTIGDGDKSPQDDKAGSAPSSSIGDTAIVETTEAKMSAQALEGTMLIAPDAKDQARSLVAMIILYASCIGVALKWVGVSVSVLSSTTAPSSSAPVVSVGDDDSDAKDQRLFSPMERGCRPSIMEELKGSSN